MTKIEDAAAAAKPDMTPMIDVVFLMIIFFLCIQFRVLEAKLPAFLPKDRGIGEEYVEPKEQLSVRVECASAGERRYEDAGRTGRYRLEGHRVRWWVGPVAVETMDALLCELMRVAQTPASLIPDRETGSRRLIPCVVEPQVGVCYADVAQTADAVNASGFAEITFGGGRPGRLR